MKLRYRPRRLRFSESRRRLITETRVTNDDLIYPLFVLDGSRTSEPIASMPGIERRTIDLLITHLKPLVDKGLTAIALFPVVESSNKSLMAEESYNPDGLIQRAITQLKNTFTHLTIISDVALDPYTSHGQDGIIDNSGYVLNDETVEVLVQQALSHAKAGADIVAPSDMMDGRIGAIRQVLEDAGYIHTAILSYAAKYASSFYGPFRDAVGSAQSLGKANKNSYQMNPANSREAIHEVALDIEEGADMVMIKPAMAYLDIIQTIKQSCTLPVLAYQVSGEYAMLQGAIDNGWLNEDVIYESLLAIKRAGADAIFSYYTGECIDKQLLLNSP